MSENSVSAGATAWPASRQLVVFEYDGLPVKRRECSLTEGRGFVAMLHHMPRYGAEKVGAGGQGFLHERAPGDGDGDRGHRL